MSDALEVAASLLGLPHLDDAATLGTGRSTVWRAATPDGTVVVKAYAEAGRSSWRREVAGLAALDGRRTPRLLAHASDPCVLVMSDLGGGGSLADLLLGRDAEAAAGGLVDWAEGLAALHAAGPEAAARFVALLGEDRGQVERQAPSPHTTHDDVASTPGRLRDAALAHDLPWSDDVADGLAQAGAPLWVPETLVVSPGDTCPDNNLVRSDGTWFLDLEFAEARHPAWDVACLRVPWPTCWCAWRIPEHAAARALAVLEAAAPHGPAGFADAVEAATLLWCLSSSSWFLGPALDEPAGHVDDGRKPGRRTMVLGRLALAARLRGPASLTQHAAELHRVLADRWGPHPLAMAPAFRDEVAAPPASVS